MNMKREGKSAPVIRLFKDEFPDKVWIAYCDILGIDKETANKIVSVCHKSKRARLGAIKSMFGCQRKERRKI